MCSLCDVMCNIVYYVLSGCFNPAFGCQHSINVCLLQLVHTADTNKTKLSRLVRVGGVNTIGDKTRQDSFVLSRIQFSI